MGQLTRPAPPAPDPAPAAPPTADTFSNVVILGSYLVMLFAMLTSIRHVADVFLSLEPSGSGRLWGYIPALAVDGGIIVMSLGIWFQQARQESATWLWVGFWVFLILSSFANTDQGVREMAGVERVTFATIWQLDGWQLLKLALFKTALPFVIAMVVEVVKHLPLPTLSAPAPPAPASTVHVDEAAPSTRTDELPSGQRTTLPPQREAPQLGADTRTDDEQRQRRPGWRGRGQRAGLSDGHGQSTAPSHPPAAAAVDAPPRPTSAPVRASTGQADTPRTLSTGQMDTAVIPPGLTQEHVIACDAYAVAGNVRDAALLLQGQGVQMGKSKLNELVQEAKARDPEWVAALIKERGR